MSTSVSTQRQSLVAKFADKYSIEPGKLLATLKATAFRQGGDKEITDEQMAALLIVADRYGLDPFTKEIYAFPDKGGIVPVVGVDGWARVVNEHPQCDGFEFTYADDFTDFSSKQVPVWMEVHIFRKDRTRPVIVREYFDEVVRRNMQPWQSHPNRMLRHKTFVQGARLAFGFAGVFDEDEGQRIVERDMGSAQEVTPVQQPQSRSARAAAAAIERADADGVIEQPATQQRQAEPAQREERSAQQTQQQPAQRTRAATTTTRQRETRSDDGDGFTGTPISDSVLRILKTKMEQCAVSESDIKKRFGFDLDGVVKENYDDVVAYIENPS
ncbi:recombinase RecT [Paraburkholderia saeva]|uniref:recombinase RecT n=1 Tax=Paraburkholderia saeva TaxID=2777537 RepID=UPI001DCE8446|nr:recombinase RecT [Paraburkholderia saeva]CAG4887784.1 hypothetical protein R52603_00511 [Paraburkholderia saeva]